jgi:transposase InsO family protein
MADEGPVAHFSTQPFKPAFLSIPGRPPIPWDRWKAMFEDWLLAIGFPVGAAMEQRKAALLRASLGTEGFRLYTSLTSNPRESYEDAIAKLASHFGPPASAIFSRAQFTRRQQQPGESVAAYVAALRELAAKCEFPAAQLNERVRDQFAAWCCVDRIRERLLQEPATKSLDDLLTLAVTMERAMAEAPALNNTDRPVNRIRGTLASRSRKQPSSSASACSNCGTLGHAARSLDCPAQGKACRGCGRVGHYVACCRSSQQSAQSSARGRSTSRSGRRRRFSRPRRRDARTNLVDEFSPTDSDASAAEVVGSVFINSVQVCPAGSFKRVTCRLADVQVSLIVDLGAKVSILARDIYERSSLSSFKLRPPDVMLRTYNGQPIECLGRVALPVSVGQVTIPQFIFYVTARGDSMMGVDLFDAIGGSLQLGDDRIIPTTSAGVATISSSSVSLEQFPALTAGLGRLRGFIHRPQIDPSVKPVQQHFYHQPLSLRQPISDELRRMERDGVIERIDSSQWISNLVVARKKNNQIRICVNLSAVNQALIPARFPLPTMEELTARLAGSTVFSKIDLRWGYMQLELAEECRYLTAFVTHDGVFQWRFLPFGLASGPSAFQQVVRRMLEGLEGCVNILDDIVVFAVDMEEHDKRLRLVLNRLQKYGATVRVDKCAIGVPEVEFNGHLLSAAGIRPLTSNVEAILRLPVPENQRQLLRFLCTATYYMKFCPGFAALCEPLRRLLRADVEWAWSADCQRAFQAVKDKLASKPVLAHFDVKARTYVTCDASADALGAVLSQFQGGVERPIAFASRALTPAERKYSASEREALSCVYACERWHFYLYGRRFTLVTDHQALKTLLTAGGTGHRPLRLHRWCDRLYQYSFDLQYKPGRDNVVADTLSRSHEASPAAIDRQARDGQPTDNATASGQVRSADQDVETVNQPATVAEISEDAADDRLVQTIFGALGTSVITLDQVAVATDADPHLPTLRQYIVSGWPAKGQLPSALKPFWAVRSELSTAVGGCVLVRGIRTIIPSSLRRTVLDLAHEGHPGVVRMKQRCRDAVWYPGIDGNIEDYIHNCTACVVSGKATRPTPGLLQPVALPTGPWRKLALDIAGEFVAAPQHQRYLIVAVDYYSKWPEVGMCGSPTTAAVTDFLTGLFERFGLVEEITTDNGVQFTSTEFAGFLQAHGIRHTKSALYSPEANAEVERFNRVIKDGLKAAIAASQTFRAGLRQLLAAYRSTPHATTGVSPASVLLAFPLRTPLSMLSTGLRQPARPADAAAHIARRVSFAQQQSSSYYNRRKRARSPGITAGDYVRIHRPTRSHKLAPTYSDPLQVARANGNTVWLTNGQRWNVRRCLLHRASFKASADRPDLAKQSQSTIPPGHAGGEKINLPSSDEEHEDEPTFRFAIAQQRASNAAPGTVTAAAQPRRHSSRARCPRNFDPYVLY